MFHNLRKRLSVTVSLVLLVVMALTFLTGFVAAALDLNRFVFHKYAAYGAIAVALLHVALHWRTLTAQAKKWLLGLGPHGRPQPEPRAGRPAAKGDTAGARL